MWWPFSCTIDLILVFQNDFKGITFIFISLLNSCSCKNVFLKVLVAGIYSNPDFLSTQVFLYPLLQTVLSLLFPYDMSHSGQPRNFSSKLDTFSKITSRDTKANVYIKSIFWNKAQAIQQIVILICEFSYSRRCDFFWKTLHYYLFSFLCSRY